MPSLAKLVFTLLTSLSPSTGQDVVVCDDNSSPYDENGRPNIDCEIDGCTVVEAVCWSERLDMCFDVDGSDNGTCNLHAETCDSGVSCFGMYLSCKGEWSCHDSHWWGCSKGSCTKPEVA